MLRSWGNGSGGSSGGRIKLLPGSPSIWEFRWSLVEHVYQLVEYGPVLAPVDDGRWGSVIDEPWAPYPSPLFVSIQLVLITSVYYTILTIYSIISDTCTINKTNLSNNVTCQVKVDGKLSGAFCYHQRSGPGGRDCLSSIQLGARQGHPWIESGDFGISHLLWVNPDVGIRWWYRHHWSAALLCIRSLPKNRTGSGEPQIADKRGKDETWWWQHQRPYQTTTNNRWTHFWSRPRTHLSWVKGPQWQ